MRNIKKPTKATKATKSATPAKTASKQASKSASKPATKQAATPANDADKAERRAISGARRDASTIAGMRANFGKLTPRDEAYAALYHEHASKSGSVTLATLRGIGVNKYHAGSAKASDAGAAQRLAKAGIITFDADTGTIAFTKSGASLGANRFKALSK